MTKQEHLLVCLSEECAEIQQAVSKALRFGLKDGYPGTERTNAGDISHELSDLMAIAELLTECGAIPHHQTIYQAIAEIQKKKEKIAIFLKYAEKCGTVL